jgi:hypothetical protein
VGTVVHAGGRLAAVNGEVERIRFKFINHLKNNKSFKSFVVESYSKIQHTPLFCTLYY